MTIQFKKGGQTDTMTCIRKDGSATWMQTTPFSTRHDLAHFAIETQLKITFGFYGLVAAGMDIADFENKQKFKPNQLHIDALQTEHLVNLFLTELSDQQPLDNFQATFDGICNNSGIATRNISSDEVGIIRNEIRKFLQQWNQTAEGNILQLFFKNYEGHSR